MTSIPYSPFSHILDDILGTSRDAIAIMTNGRYDSNKLPIKQGGAIEIKHNSAHNLMFFNLHNYCRNQYSRENLRANMKFLFYSRVNIYSSRTIKSRSADHQDPGTLPTPLTCSDIVLALEPQPG